MENIGIFLGGSGCLNDTWSKIKQGYRLVVVNMVIVSLRMRTREVDLDVLKGRNAVK